MVAKLGVADAPTRREDLCVWKSVHAAKRTSSNRYGIKSAFGALQSRNAPAHQAFGQSRNAITGSKNVRILLLHFCSVIGSHGANR